MMRWRSQDHGALAWALAGSLTLLGVVAAGACGDDGALNLLPQTGTGTAGAGGATGGTGGDGGLNIGLEGGSTAQGGAAGGPQGPCGNAKIDDGESCDDQNQTAGDGCDADCQLEPGWICPVVGAACVAAECGDGFEVGDEQCDDGDDQSDDGCSSTCRLEPGWKCPTPGSDCEPTECGDGVVEGTEQCDDGNHDMGDGCTPFCVNEPDCSQGACTSSCGDGLKLPGGGEQCEDGNTDSGDGCSASCQIEPGYVCDDVTTEPTQLDLPIVLRDFTPSNGDFEGPCCDVDPGIVLSDLGSDGKPVYAGQSGNPMTTGQANFDEWYRDVPGSNLTLLQTLTLPQINPGQYQYASSAFFPLDGLGFGDYGSYGHNFHFTSEVRYWFEYDPPQQLDFTGDDDVFVFVNKKLAVDLGGVHGVLPGSVTLDASTQAQFGLALGSIYEIVVFQAERHTTASNYRLTLSGFVNALSECHSVCGDGIKTPDEVCDDGVNDGSYGHCTEDCLFGPYCGDGEVQPPYEECDDGNQLNGDDCSSTCQNIVPT